LQAKPQEGGINILDESSSISNQQPPIADLEHPYAFSPIDIAECRRMFQIGDRWLLSADPSNERLRHLLRGVSMDWRGRR
jgi:hypothetical protein